MPFWLLRWLPRDTVYKIFFLVARNTQLHYCSKCVDKELLGVCSFKYVTFSGRWVLPSKVNTHLYASMHPPLHCGFLHNYFSISLPILGHCDYYFYWSMWKKMLAIVFSQMYPALLSCLLVGSCEYSDSEQLIWSLSSSLEWLDTSCPSKWALFCTCNCLLII